MPLHRTDTGPGWINRRFAKIERQMQQDRAARRLENSTIGRRGLRIRGGDLFLEDTAGQPLWQASKDPIKTGKVYAEESDLPTIPSSWTVMGFGSIAAPAGFVGVGHFNVMASCGLTMSGTNDDDLVRRDGFYTPVGSVSVQPVFRYRYEDDTTSAWFAGPGIASPESRIAVASSLWASNFAMSSFVAFLDIGVQAVRSFGTADAGTGNWHVAASVIFKRG